MASATAGLCVTCNKGKGIFKCEGCGQSFCPKDSVNHRNELNKQLEDILVVHDDLIEQMKDSRPHPSIAKVNRWEEESIGKIRHMAEEIRMELTASATQHPTEVKQKLQSVAAELRRGHDENDFSEIDLRQWTQTLEELRDELLNPATLCVGEDTAALVRKIFLEDLRSSDVFERVSRAAQIRDGGLLVVKDVVAGHVEVRGKREYHRGKHTLRFQVGQLIENGWIYFGVISKSERQQDRSFGSSSSYGWSNKNQVYPAGQYASDPTCEIINGDIVDLTIDCSRAQIQLRNERLQQTLELPVDVTKCAFPWQLHLNLHESNTTVRIISPTN